MKEEIKKKLIELSDEKYKEFHGKLCPGVENILGVRVPILRNYAKELLKQYQLEKLLSNIGNEYYEEIMLQGMLIGLSKDISKEEFFKYVKEFVLKIDNWAVCDVCVAGLKMTKKYKKEMWSFLEEYLNSDKEFEIRFAIIVLLDFYIDDEHIDDVLKILDNIKNDGYYVKMGIAWTISLCLVRYYDKTMKYLKGCNLDNFTYNKSLQKAIESYRITDDQKEILRSMKKSG